MVQLGRLTICVRGRCRGQFQRRLDDKHISAYNSGMRRKPGGLVPLEQDICIAGFDLKARRIEEFHGYQLAKMLKDERQPSTADRLRHPLPRAGPTGGDGSAREPLGRLRRRSRVRIAPPVVFTPSPLPAAPLRSRLSDLPAPARRHAPVDGSCRHEFEAPGLRGEHRLRLDARVHVEAAGGRSRRSTSGDRVGFLGIPS